MDVRSLGLIETWGLTAAIEAADAGAKAANVSLLGLELARGGLVTVKFSGDVAAVHAAVSAASVAAGRVGKVVSTHVIARPNEQLHRVGLDGAASRDRRPPAVAAPVGIEVVPVQSDAVAPDVETPDGSADPAPVEPPAIEPSPIPEITPDPQEPVSPRESAVPSTVVAPRAVEAVTPPPVPPASKGSAGQPGKRTRRPKPKNRS
ncbi:BMC domain-containing protein [Telmatospirillum siberiense]|uniref:BMC domain-containing protein n=1 Tax=Telmatospirillum siberiense TaxID=382514 RepID=A0A2N3PUK1_9PROT|nr:hypothetical protein CWS72_13340 [Telmatospirillum siberiense]